MSMDNNITKGAVTLSVGTMGVFNYALYENRIAPVRGIKLYNHTDHIVAGLSLKVSTDSGFFKEWRGSVQPLPAVKEAMELSSNPDLIVEGKRLAEVTDAFTINVTVSLLAGDQEIDSVTGQMNILAYDQWMGDEYPEHLAAFVIPNHPVVMGLVHDASMILKAWGEKAMLEGYQTEKIEPENGPVRVRLFAAAIFEAIKRRNITYSNPPAKGGVCPIGQRIRTPEIVMEQRLATCMDFSLLYAACLEAIGLNPVLYLTHNYIFTGVWLKDQTYFKHARNVDLGEVVKNITPGSQKIVFVECTLMRADSDAQFANAEKKPTEEVFTKAEFDYLLDVGVARKRIKALPSRQIKGSPFQIDVEKFDTSSFPAAPAPISIHYDTEAQFEKGKGITDKFELWKSKLLDLTGNNMLLNLPYKGNALPIMSYRVDEMARVVLEGEEFHLLPIL